MITKRIRIVFSDLILLSIALAVFRVHQYRPYLSMLGALTFLLKTCILLLVYGAAVFLSTRSPSPPRDKALHRGTIFGVTGGGLLSVHLLIENTVDFGRLANGAVTLSFMLSVFLLWSICAFTQARSGESFPLAVFSGVWSALTNMLITVAFGFTLLYFMGPPPQEVAAWNEFHRSGWSDARAFAIADTLDSANSHLMIGPVIGLVFACAGAAVGNTWRRGKRTAISPA